jgi:hypothetical protein
LSHVAVGDSAKKLPMSWLTYGIPMLAAEAVNSEANASCGHVAHVSPVNWIVYLCSANAPLPLRPPKPAW